MGNCYHIAAESMGTECMLMFSEDAINSQPTIFTVNPLLRV